MKEKNIEISNAENDGKRIELTASDKNIIRFCLERSIRLEKYYDHFLGESPNNAMILRPVLEKLKAIYKKETEEGREEESIYF